MSGYRITGSRAIRIDMLERLADQLRNQDSRSGFEATPDMLSITGMTLEQFSELLQGLGYHVEKGERPKLKAAAPVQSPAAPEASDAAEPAHDADAAETGEIALEAAAGESESMALAEEAVVAEDVGVAEEAAAESALPDVAQSEPVADTAEPEIETFYTFTWAPRRQSNARPRPAREERRSGKPREDAGGKPREERQGGKPREKGKPKSGKRPEGKGGRDNRDERDNKAQGAKTFQARPPKKEKPIDPDNPFAAALMGLTGKK